MTLITFTTDFGWDLFPAMMKGEILRIAPDVRFVDVSHGIEPQSVREGAYVLWRTVGAFPEGSIHVCVVDPGVGTDRLGIMVKCKRGTLIGPDNDLMGAAARTLGCPRESGGGVHSLDYERVREAYGRAVNGDVSVSRTFHGRDLFARAAALLAAGVPMEEFTDPLPDWEAKDLVMDYEKEGDRIRGVVLSIERFGNIVTSIPIVEIDTRRIHVTACGKRFHNLELFDTYSEVPHDDPFFLSAPTGLIEVAVRNGSAASRMGIRSGEDIVVRPA